MLLGHIELISQKDKSRREMKVKSKAGKVLKSTLAASFAFSFNSYFSIETH
mgnify:CR=1 FL=1